MVSREARVGGDSALDQPGSALRITAPCEQAEQMQGVGMRRLAGKHRLVGLLGCGEAALLMQLQPNGDKLLHGQIRYCRLPEVS